MKQIKVLAFPRDPNPYQELLYTPMRKENVVVDYLEGPTKSQTINLLLLPGMLVLKRVQGYNVLHVHWTWPFYLPWAKRMGRLPMEVLATFCWRMAKLIGYRLVWTAHNAVPQDKHFSNDRRAHRTLGNLADVVIAHSVAAKKQLRELGVRSDNEHIRVIPHGNYVGAYPDTISAESARRKLHIPQGDTVLLLFGLIRPYKGIEQFLSAYNALSDDDKEHLTVLVAGPPHDEDLAKQLRRAQRRSSKKIRLSLKFIPKKEVQLYFRSADFTVLPYQASTTSGVALLAASFDCPIIAPKQAAFASIPAAMLISYTNGGLHVAIRRILKTSKRQRDAMRAVANAYAASLSWVSIADRTLKYCFKFGDS